MASVTTRAAPPAAPPDLPYAHATDACFAARIGDGGLASAAFAAALKRARPALAEVRRGLAANRLPMLAVARRGDDLARLAEAARRLRDRFDDVVVLGTGGSSLGGRALAALADAGHRPRLHFLDNVDPDTVAGLLRALDLRGTGFLAISKSGATAETLAQTLVALDALCAAVGREAAARHLTAIVEPGESPLRRLAAAWGIETLDHDPGIPGRYAALSAVGVVPALVAGRDPAALRAGAAAALDAALAGEVRRSPPAVGAAIAVGLYEARGIATSVVMPYADRLEPFARWYRQLWAESLGKDGRGLTPAAALGAVDQHSQLQLYLDGPRDKLVTLITLARDGTGPRIPAELAAGDDLAWLAGRTVGDVMAAAQRATAETLAAHGVPVREIRLARLDERALGALMMHFMLETIVAAALLGVDPFGQPAVDDGKARARAHLAGGGAP